MTAVDESLADALQRAVQGLLYTSESDAPFAVIQWPDCPAPLTPEEVLTRAGREPNAPVTQQSMEAFFQPLTADQAWYGEKDRAAAQRYRQLRALLEQHLRDAQVFRVGKVEVTVYIIGHTADGQCVGLRTTAVET